MEFPIQQNERQFSEQVCNVFFSNNDHATGDDILAFTEINQVNYMMIYILFANWEKDLEKLKSPYFDFENEQVKDALKKFMNVVSKNISVGKEDMIDLLDQSVVYSRSLTEEPKAFLKTLFGTDTTVSEIKRMLRFVKVNKDIIEELIADKADEDVISLEFKAEKEEDKAPVEAPTAEAEETGEEVEEEHKDEVEIDFSTQDQPEEPIVAEEKEEIIEEEEETIEETVAEENLESVTANADGNAPTSLFADDAEVETLHKKLSPEVETQNLGDKLGQSKISSIKTTINLNQKFVFIRELFNGNEEQYVQTVNTLDKADSYKDAIQLFQDYTSELQWDSESQAVTKMKALVDRKFL